MKSRAISSETFSKNPSIVTPYERNLDSNMTICVPRLDSIDGFYWFKLPKDIFTHKIYPTCQCGKKFVPMNHIEGAAKRCLYCVLKGIHIKPFHVIINK